MRDLVCSKNISAVHCTFHCGSTADSGNVAAKVTLLCGSSRQNILPCYNALRCRHLVIDSASFSACFCKRINIHRNYEGRCKHFTDCIAKESTQTCRTALYYMFTQSIIWRAAYKAILKLVSTPTWRRNFYGCWDIGADEFRPVDRFIVTLWMQNHEANCRTALVVDIGFVDCNSHWCKQFPGDSNVFSVSRAAAAASWQGNASLVESYSNVIIDKRTTDTSGRSCQLSVCKQSWQSRC